MICRAALPLFAVALATGSASALSCAPPTVERAFASAQAAAETYVPVLGRFTGVAPRRGDETVQGRDRRYTAHFQGRFVTSAGLGGSLRADVAVTETCLGAWCPTFVPGAEVLTFLQRDGRTYRFEVTACHGNYFSDPDAAQIRTMQSCLRTWDCGFD